MFKNQTFTVSYHSKIKGAKFDKRPKELGIGFGKDLADDKGFSNAPMTAIFAGKKHRDTIAKYVYQ